MFWFAEFAAMIAAKWLGWGATMLLPLCAHAETMSEAIDATLLPGCQWKDQTVFIHGRPNQQLSFRYQDCDTKDLPKVVYALNEREELIQSWGGDHGGPVARFWLLDGERPFKLIRKVSVPSIDPKEIGRCVVHLDFASETYNFEPDAAYMEELLATDEPFTSCGDYGTTNNAIQYFVVIDNMLLAYVWLGQDTPFFDPASFRYVNTEKPGVVE
jgi:hypothetical protein